MPTSPCGPDCVEGENPPSVGRIRVVLRLAMALLVLLAAGIASPLLVLTPRRGRQALVRALFNSLLRAFGVRMVVHGRSRLVRRPGDQQGVMMVNNHISWLDIVALNAVQPMRALAKSELRSWPVLGGLIRRAGTVFVDRENLRSLPGTVAELAEAFRSGSMVNVAGEGTTWCGKASGRYVPAPFQAAIDGGAAVLPVALRYRLANGRQTTAPAFIGTESLIASLMRVARVRGLTVEMFVCPPIPPGKTDNRRELADLTESAVLSALGITAAMGSRPWQPRILEPDAEQVHIDRARRADSAA